MCIPGVDSSGNEATFGAAAGSFAWGKAFEGLGPVGAYVSQILTANAKASDSDWIAHSRSDKIRLEFASGNTLVLDAANVDPAVLAAYGLSFNSVDGVVSTRSRLDSGEGVLSGPDWTLKDGVLKPPPTTSVTGEVLGNSLLEIPESAFALAGSGSLLANAAFDGVLGLSIPDERLASRITAQLGSAATSVTDAPPVVFTQVEGDPTGDLSVERRTNASRINSSGNAPAAGSELSSSYANEMAAERARNLAGGFAQAEVAQQAEYVANQAAKDAAKWSRIDQDMSQVGAASASASGPAPAVPAAPGYGPADVLANEQPTPGVSAADVQPGYFSRQGVFKDGRWFPNVIKPINQAVWAAWGKSHGVEAALTLPFVLAMSGALALPQAFNDIPNIPTLILHGLVEADMGHPLDALEALGDGFFALGILGEAAQGVRALSEAAGAVDNVHGPGGVRPKKYNPDLFGPPKWEVKNLRPHGDVVVQSAKTSCNAASAEMVARLSGVDEAVTEEAILSYLREKYDNPRIALGDGGIDGVEVAEAANHLDPAAGSEEGLTWVSRSAVSKGIAEINRIGANGPWVAEIQTSDVWHAVTVVGRDGIGDLVILDPAGYRYEMTVAEFTRVWNGDFLARQ